MSLKTHQEGSYLNDQMNRNANEHKIITESINHIHHASPSIPYDPCIPTTVQIQSRVMMCDKQQQMRVQLILLLALYLTLSTAFKRKTNETLTASFNEYDEDQDGKLSFHEADLYFRNDYMKEFEGIEIDPKFVDSTFEYLINADADGNGLDLDEFKEALMPKDASFFKKEPGFYDEQDL